MIATDCVSSVNKDYQKVYKSAGGPKRCMIFYGLNQWLETF